MSNNKNNKGFFGTGTIFIDAFDESGASTGFVKIGSGKTLSLKPNSDTKEVLSKAPESYGQPVSSVTIPGKTDLKIGHSDFDSEVMGMVFLGKVEESNQGSGSLTGKEITISKTGRWFALGHRNFASENFIVKDSSDATLTPGTDYTVDYSAGLIYPIRGGGVADGEKIKVTANYNSLTGKRILGATRPSIKAAIKFEGVNQENGKKCSVDIWETTLQPDSEIDFLSDSHIETSLSGAPMVVEGKDSTFEVFYED